MIELREVLLSILGIFLAFPAGVLLARLTRDELVKGRKFFELLVIGAFIMTFSALFLQDHRLGFTIVLTMVFTIIVSLVSLYKSFDQKFITK